MASSFREEALTALIALKSQFKTAWEAIKRDLDRPLLFGDRLYVHQGALVLETVDGYEISAQLPAFRGIGAGPLYTVLSQAGDKMTAEQIQKELRLLDYGAEENPPRVPAPVPAVT